MALVSAMPLAVKLLIIMRFSSFKDYVVASFLLLHGLILADVFLRIGSRERECGAPWWTWYNGGRHASSFFHDLRAFCA